MEKHRLTKLAPCSLRHSSLSDSWWLIKVSTFSDQFKHICAISTCSGWNFEQHLLHSPCISSILINGAAICFTRRRTFSLEKREIYRANMHRIEYESHWKWVVSLKLSVNFENCIDIAWTTSLNALPSPSQRSHMLCCILLHFMNISWAKTLRQSWQTTVFKFTFKINDKRHRIWVI